MILFLILLFTLLILVGVSITVISVTGAAGIIIFGDVIVCIWLIIWLIKKLIQRKK